MTQLNNNKRLDNPNGSVEIQPNNAMNANEQSKKTPWHLRFAGAILAVAGIFLSPLPSGKIQAQCAEFDPNDCLNPCYVPPPPPRYDNDEFDAANSREDCDRILQEVLDAIEETNKEINDAWKAAEYCDTRYGQEMEMNETRLQGAMASAELEADNILYECLGISALVGGGAYKGSRWTMQRIRGGLTATVRVGTAALGTVVTIGVFAACKSTRDDTLQSLIDAANKEKELADKMSLSKRDNCRITTNYRNVKRRYSLWRGGRYPSGKGYRYRTGGYRNAKAAANADHAKCLALFPSGDCSTTD